jgi:hypothetical protein
MARSRSLQFSTELFDYGNDLPPESNAGNRFYGRDVAEFVATGLTLIGWPSTSFDEDWGWLVTSTDRSGHPFEVAVNNINDHGVGGRPGANRWGLWLRAYEFKRALGLVRHRSEIDVPTGLETALRAVFSVEGITLEEWDDA